jgi:starch synthase
VKKKLNILFISSEMTPFAKTGGLADVTAALAANLRARGHDVRVVMPLYPSARRAAGTLKTILNSMCVTMGIGEQWCALRSTTAAGGVPVIFVENDFYFSRKGLYHDAHMNDYSDNPRRFALLCRAALQYCFDCGFAPDIVHAHDWQAALAPAYMKIWFWNAPPVANAASVLTIHNISYQGTYPAEHYPYLGLGKENFTEKKFECWGAVNFLKGGIFYCDVANTVSPGHAREIRAPHGGFGLAPYLSDKGDNFSGILNGADYSVWSPEADNLIPANYSWRDPGPKAMCKKHLQESFQLTIDNNTCIIACIGRFVEQKGFNLIRDCIDRILRDMHVQFAILGEGDNALERFFGALPSRHPGRAASFIGHDAERAHCIEAGADFFLMPSLFEPCGLNQIYSLRYGTPPIVRATGGLDDTVEQYNERTGDGTGFKFQNATPQAVYDTVGWAVSTYYDRPHHLKAMITRAMRKDFSWKKSVVAYERLYSRAIKQKTAYDRAGALA